MSRLGTVTRDRRDEPSRAGRGGRPICELTKEFVRDLPKNGESDPILYYRRPLVGWLFRERINMGLRLLPAQDFEHVVEVGYAAGAVLLTLAPHTRHLHGLDRDADPAPVHALLSAHGHEAELVKGDIYEMPFATGMADLVVAFSIFEHLSEYKRGLSEVRRVLRVGGHFLLGMPAVNRAMEAGFLAIGFRGVEHHHVTTPAMVARSFAEEGFRVVAKKNLGLPIPGMALYYNFLLERT